MNRRSFFGRLFLGAGVAAMPVQAVAKPAAAAPVPAVNLAVHGLDDPAMRRVIEHEVVPAIVRAIRENRHQARTAIREVLGL